MFFLFSPLQTPCANFEYMLWFESLLFYGFEEHSALQRGDGDIGLLPAIVEKVILSKLTGRQTRSAWHTWDNFLELKMQASTKFAPCIYEFVCVSVLAEQVWDPLSSSQTMRLVSFIHRLMKGYPTVLHGDNRYTQVLTALSLPTSTSLHNRTHCCGSCSGIIVIFIFCIRSF